MTMFIALAVLLGAAKLAGEIMQKLDQPSVLGEIMAGILLGTTVLGHFKPAWYAFIFPATGNLPIVLETVTTLGVVFFLLTAGLEIDLRSIYRQGRSALLVSFLGVIIPFALGFGAAEWSPQFLGAETGANTRAMYVETSSEISSRGASVTPARAFANSFLNSTCIERAIWIRCACGDPAPCMDSVR